MSKSIVEAPDYATASDVYGNMHHVLEKLSKSDLVLLANGAGIVTGKKPKGDIIKIILSELIGHAVYRPTSAKRTRTRNQQSA